MKSKTVILLCLVPFLVATTCEDEGNNIDCGGQAVAGLNIYVHPDTAEAHISAEGITVTATDEAFSEVLTYSDETNPVFSGAYERPGNYIITVTKAGYQTYISPVIAVGKLGCHVTGEQFDVILLPE